MLDSFEESESFDFDPKEGWYYNQYISLLEIKFGSFTLGTVMDCLFLNRDERKPVAPIFEVPPADASFSSSDNSHHSEKDFHNQDVFLIQTSAKT